MSIVEVAKHANVSIATVSRVLNNSRRVDHVVAERVRRVARELRYTPLRDRRPKKEARPTETHLRSIALVAVGHPAREWFGVPVMASIVAEITRVASVKGFAVMIEELADSRKLTTAFKQRGVDAALAFISSWADPGQAHALARQMPMVQILGNPLTTASIDYVGPDHGRIGYIAAEYLLSRGCKTLGVLSTAAKGDVTFLRAQGFSWAARHSGALPTVFLTSDDAHAVDCYGPRVRTKPTLAELVDEMIAAKPDGLFVTRDVETVEVYRLLESRGIRPDQDIA